MGHLINPVLHRLGYSRFWDSNWSLSSASANVNTSYLSTENIFLATLLKKIFIQFGRRLFRKANILSGFRLLNIHKKIIFCVEVRFKFLPIIYNRIGQCLNIVKDTFKHKPKYRKLVFRIQKKSSQNRLPFNKKRLANNKQLFRQNQRSWLLKKHPVKKSSFSKFKSTSISNMNTKSGLITKNRQQTNRNNRELLGSYSQGRVQRGNQIGRIQTINKSERTKPDSKVSRIEFNKTMPKVYHDFFRNSRRAQVYVSTLNFVDLAAYNWNLFAQATRMKKLSFSIFKKKSYYCKRKNLSKFLKVELIKYLFSSWWSKTLKIFFHRILARVYSNVPEVKVLLLVNNINTITASFVARYIAVKLIQRQPLRRLVFMIMRQMQNAIEGAWILGFRLACSGRFERRGRATHIWKITGKVPASNQNVSVDYSIMLPTLINSICAVKVWLTRAHAPEKLLIN